MKRLTIVIILIVVAWVGFTLGRLTGEQGTLPAQEAVQRDFPQPPPPPTSIMPVQDWDEVDRDLILEIPVEGAVLGGLFELTGRARKDIRDITAVLKDADGEIMARVPVGSPQGEGEFGRFSTEIDVGDGLAGDGTLEISWTAPDFSIHGLTRQVTFVEADAVLIEVFFGDEQASVDDCREVSPVSRTISAKDRLYRSAVEALLAGPTEEEEDEGLFTSIPSSARLKSAAADADGVVTVDFTSGLEYGVAGSCRVTAIRSQIERTLEQFPEVNGVVISVNGRTEDVLQP